MTKFKHGDILMEEDDSEMIRIALQLPNGDWWFPWLCYAGNFLDGGSKFREKDLDIFSDTKIIGNLGVDFGKIVQRKLVEQYEYEQIPF